MRAQLGFGVRTGLAVDALISRDQLDIVLVEETILQRNVDIVGDRVTNTRDRLPGETGVAVVHDVRSELAARNADTAADEALQAVIGTEVQQTVQHERQGRSSAAEAAAGLVEIDLRTLVGGFGFEAEATEVVTDVSVEVVALVVVDRRDRRTTGRDGVEGQVLIFNEQHAGVHANIPAIITRQGRGGQGTGRKRSREGKLPHMDSPFKSVTKDC